MKWWHRVINGHKQTRYRVTVFDHDAFINGKVTDCSCGMRWMT